MSVRRLVEEGGGWALGVLGTAVKRCSVSRLPWDDTSLRRGLETAGEQTAFSVQVSSCPSPLRRRKARPLCSSPPSTTMRLEVGILRPAASKHHVLTEASN